MIKIIKNQEGFTLIECLTVLLCISVFFTVPLIALKKWQEKAEVEHFFSQLERNIQRTHQSAIVDGKDTWITQDEVGNKLRFAYCHHWQRYIIEFPMLDSLNLTSEKTIEFIGVKGNIREITNIRIVDAANNRVVEYSFQLGSGKVIRNDKKL